MKLKYTCDICSFSLKWSVEPVKGGDKCPWCRRGILKKIANQKIHLTEGRMIESTQCRITKFNKCNNNIGWAAYSWNPITGCNHGCDYCYAAAMSKRFNWSFNPTFHEDRLSAPANTPVNPKLNNRVFVCSMGELFGEWVPSVWIEKVFGIVRANPQWTFLFLTKSPERYSTLDWPANAWIGATIDTQPRVEGVYEAFNKLFRCDGAIDNIAFVSCEPLLEEISLPDELLSVLDWLIIGAKSEGAKKIQPKTEWVESLLTQAKDYGIPVWMKDNLVYRTQEVPE